MNETFTIGSAWTLPRVWMGHCKKRIWSNKAHPCCLLSRKEVHIYKQIFVGITMRIQALSKWVDVSFNSAGQERCGWAELNELSVDEQSFVFSFPLPSMPCSICFSPSSFSPLYSRNTECVWHEPTQTNVFDCDTPLLGNPLDTTCYQYWRFILQLTWWTLWWVKDCNQFMT